MDLLTEFIKRAGYMLYIMNPWDHVFENVKDVPDYYKEATPVFIVAIMIEQLVILLKKRRFSRANDSIANICLGMVFEVFKIPLRGIELLAYTWVYKNYRITDLPWDPAWTWLLCLIGTDFFFYWMHRACHQVSILWSIHEIHHSSEEFNLMAPLRNSILTTAGFSFVYVPMAFFVPPPIYLVHFQMNIIYQFWLHTELVPPLGFIEKIFVTPSHHRIHHGRNRRCIDKNFGAFLIIWDKMFGTFQTDDGSHVSYGLVHPAQTFEPVSLQILNFRNIWRRFWKVEGFWNKLSVIFKGPGWTPGSPWLGNVDDIPEPKEGDPKYNPHLPTWMRYYVIIHLGAVILGYLQVILNLKILPTDVITWSCTFIFFSTVSFGLSLDGSSWIPFVEILRCVLYFITDDVISAKVASLHIITHYTIKLYRWLYLLTFCFWISGPPKVSFLRPGKAT